MNNIPMEEFKILCVDDEPNVINAIKRLLMDEPYEVLIAGSGKEGLEVLRKEDIQLIIADYRMPGMTGIEFLRQVREYWPDTIRIVLSGYADTAAIVGAINEGQIYKFIPKPWNDEELKIAISNALESYSLSRKNKELTMELKEQYKEMEKLLREKNEILELRVSMLASHQNIMDSIPVGILGVDLENVIIQCNLKWAEISGESNCIARDAEMVLPPHVFRFVEEVKQKGKAVEKCEINGTKCFILGSYMTIKKQKGVILSLIREDELLQAVHC